MEMPQRDETCCLAMVICGVEMDFCLDDVVFLHAHFPLVATPPAKASSSQASASAWAGLSGRETRFPMSG